MNSKKVFLVGDTGFDPLLMQRRDFYRVKDRQADSDKGMLLVGDTRFELVTSTV